MRFLHRFNKLILAASTLVGTIIGVGMFGLPFVASRAGFVPVVFFLVFLGAIITTLHLVYGEVVLRTKERHRLTGYAKKYLGKKGELIAGFTFFFGLYGALLAYLVLGGQFLSLFLAGLSLSLSPFASTVILALVSFAIVFKGIQNVGFFEILMTAVLLTLILGLLIYGSGFISLDNVSLGGTSSFLLLPYGVIFFSLWGASVVPEIRRFFARDAHLFKKSIIMGTVIPIVVFIIFTFVVLGISGASTTPDAISGLVPSLGVLFSTYGALVGLLAVLSSFVALSITVGDSFRLDFNVPRNISLGLAFAVPLIIFFLGARNFISIIDWVGAILGSFEGLLLLSLHKRAKEKGNREPEYTIDLRKRTKYFIVLVLILAVVSRFV